MPQPMTLDEGKIDVSRDTTTIQEATRMFGMEDWLNGPSKMLEYLAFTRVVSHLIRKAVTDEDNAQPTPERLAVDIYLALQRMAKNEWIGIPALMRCGNPIPDEIAGYLVAIYTLDSVNVYGIKGQIYKRIEDMGYRVGWLDDGQLEVADRRKD